MELDVFGLLCKTENQARLFFKKFCWKSGHVYCTRCRSCKIYKIVNKRYRCKPCGYTFHDFSNRWINKLNISFRQWMWIIKLFELEISTLRIADQVRLSYPTVLKAVTLLRTAVFVNDGDAEGFFHRESGIDFNYEGKEREREKKSSSESQTPVIGITKKNGVVKVKAVRGFENESFLKKAIDNGRQYTDGGKEGHENCEYLMFCDYKYLKVNHRGPSSDGKPRISGMEGFLSYAKERLAKFHGISRERFPLYMKEIEFRYNHRLEDLFVLFAKDLCTIVPSRMSKLL